MQAEGSTKVHSTGRRSSFSLFCKRVPPATPPVRLNGPQKLRTMLSHVLDANNVAGQKAAGNGQSPAWNPAEGLATGSGFGFRFSVCFHMVGNPLVWT